MPKIINSTSVGNTKQDNTKVISKPPIKIKLTPQQIAALEKQKNSKKPNNGIVGTPIKKIYDGYTEFKEKIIDSIDKGGRAINVTLNPNIKGSTQDLKNVKNKIPENSKTITSFINNAIPLPENISQLVAASLTRDKNYSIANAPKSIQLALYNSIKNAHKRTPHAGEGMNTLNGTEYNDYSEAIGNMIQKGKMNMFETIVGSALSSEFNAATTFGRVSYRYNKKDNTYDVYDSYDFNKVKSGNKGYSKFRKSVGDAAEVLGISNKESDANYIGTFDINEFDKKEKPLLDISPTTISNFEENVDNSKNFINEQLNNFKFANGGNMKKKKYAIGGEVINTMPIKKKKYQTGGNSEEVPFWGTDNKGYTPEYLATLDTAKRNPVTMARLSKELPQVTSPEDLQRLGTDGKIEEVHNWLQRNTIKTTPLPQHTVAYRAKIGDVRVNSKQFVEIHNQQFNKRLDEARNDSTTAYNEMMKKDFPGVTKIDNKNTPNELLTKIKGKPSAKNFEAKAYAYGGEVEKPKYFLGAVLGLAGQAASMIMQNNAQKKQVAAQNKLVAEENAKQMEQRIDTEEVSQRNFGSNTPMHSFYAKGGNLGVVPESVGMSVVKGAKHENGGVDYKQVEVEGGEVIKHEGSNDFIFSDRIAFDDKNTYGDVAKQFAEQKGTIEKQVGMTLKKLDKFNKDYSKSGSKLKASTTNRLMEKTNLELAKLKEQDNQIEQQVEQLKEHQLQKGMALGLYNEDGTPKDTDGKFGLGSWINGVWVEDVQESNNLEEQDYGNLEAANVKTFNGVDTTKSNPNFIKGVGNFLGSNAGQAVMGIAGAGINLLSNINTTRNMSKLKTPSFVPTKIQDTSKVNMSASRQSIEDSANEQNTYAEQNFANPQVAAAMKAKVEADKLKRLGEVNQQEQTTNIGIEDSNIARRAQMESANNAGFQQKQLMDYQKTSQDINNASNVVGALVKDTNDVMTNYRKGVMEERTIDMYSKAYAGSVSEELKAAMMDGVDLQKVRNMSVADATSYLSKKGLSEDKINKWVKQYAK